MDLEKERISIFKFYDLQGGLVWTVNFHKFLKRMDFT